MAYIGRTPDYGAFEKQTFTADGSTTTFSLNYTVGSSSSILILVSGVVQEPEVAYNIASGGTQVVFTAAPESAETVYVVFLGQVYDAAGLLSTYAITGQTELAAIPADDVHKYDDDVPPGKGAPGAPGQSADITKDHDDGDTEKDEEIKDRSFIAKNGLKKGKRK